MTSPVNWLSAGFAFGGAAFAFNFVLFGLVHVLSGGVEWTQEALFMPALTTVVAALAGTATSPLYRPRARGRAIAIGMGVVAFTYVMSALVLMVFFGSTDDITTPRDAVVSFLWGLLVFAPLTWLPALPVGAAVGWGLQKRADERAR